MEDNYVRDDTGRSSQARDAEAASNDPCVAEATSAVVVDIRGVAVRSDNGDTIGRVVVGAVVDEVHVARRARFNMVRTDRYQDDESFYDVVDYKSGTERVMARRVRFQPACEIVVALNVCEELTRK